MIVNSISPVAGSTNGSVIIPAAFVEIAPMSISPSGRILSSSHPGNSTSN